MEYGIHRLYLASIGLKSTSERLTPDELAWFRETGELPELTSDRPHTCPVCGGTGRLDGGELT